MGSIQGGGNRPLADRDGPGDRSVVEIGVVAEEENKTLPLGELLNRRPNQLTPRVFDSPFGIRQLVELMLYSFLRAGITGCVHDDLPHPPVKIAATFEAMTLPHSSHEGLMDDVGCEIGTTGYSRCDATQLGQPSFVHRS
jgi:hypothetical protein